LAGTDQVEWHQIPGDHVFDVFETIPPIPLQPLPRAHPPQLRRHLCIVCLQPLAERWKQSHNAHHNPLLNQPNVFIEHHQMSQSAVQKSSLKPQTASNADVKARWLGKTP
jgi:hypothetical protein